MSSNLIESIISSNEDLRNHSISSLLQNMSLVELRKDAEDLEQFHRSTSNLYYKVRASLFLFVICRFLLLSSDGIVQSGQIPMNNPAAELLGINNKDVIPAILQPESSPA